jgi:hypothetical protein
MYRSYHWPSTLPDLENKNPICLSLLSQNSLCRYWTDLTTLELSANVLICLFSRTYLFTVTGEDFRLNNYPPINCFVLIQVPEQNLAGFTSRYGRYAQFKNFTITTHKIVMPQTVSFYDTNIPVSLQIPKFQ